MIQKLARRPTIGEDPLDQLVPIQAAIKASKSGLAQATPRPPTFPPVSTYTKVRATFHIPAELLAEARNAVVCLSGPPVRLTLATLAETALRRELNHLKKTHHKGKDFPHRAGALKGGRPIGS